VARGHETASQQGSRRASDHVVDDGSGQYLTPTMGYTFQHTSQQPQGWEGQSSAGGEETGGYYGESPFYYPDYDTGGGGSAR
jgi:hypothetical protein